MSRFEIVTVELDICKRRKKKNIHFLPTIDKTGLRYFLSEQ